MLQADLQDALSDSFTAAEQGLLCIEAAPEPADVMCCVGMQLPFRSSKYELDVNEPGLGKISGCHISIKAEVRGRPNSLHVPAILPLLPTRKLPS